MPYCPRCGKEVAQDTKFCHNCGADLRPGGRPTADAGVGRAEKSEKEEKGEKSEKEEKHEKEGSPIGALVGGLILIFIGVTFYLTTTSVISVREAWPYFLVFLGLVIIIIAVYVLVTAPKRNPRP